MWFISTIFLCSREGLAFIFWGSEGLTGSPKVIQWDWRIKYGHKITIHRKWKVFPTKPWSSEKKEKIHSDEGKLLTSDCPEGTISRISRAPSFLLRASFMGYFFRALRSQIWFSRSVSLSKARFFFLYKYLEYNSCIYGKRWNKIEPLVSPMIKLTAFYPWKWNLPKQLKYR